MSGPRRSKASRIRIEDLNYNSAVLRDRDTGTGDAIILGTANLIYSTLPLALIEPSHQCNSATCTHVIAGPWTSQVKTASRLQGEMERYIIKK